MRKTITAHIVVMNEEKWVWFAIKSVVDYMDQLIIYDTGSTDKTVEIIEWFINHPEYGSKIVFEEKGRVNREEFVQLRDEQVKRTSTDYFLVIDGDEIYTKRQMEELIEKINSKENYDIGIMPFICCGGDVYHYRDPRRETYTHADKKGAFSMRLVSMHIPGIHCVSPDGKWDGYYDINNTQVALENEFRGYFSKAGGYFHTSFLMRSSTREQDALVGWPSGRMEKLKKYGTWDYAFPKDYYYTEVFFDDTRPVIVDDPWKKPFDFERMILQFFKRIKMTIKPLKFEGDLSDYGL